jgi:CBS-domain-containing membrane protein
METLLLKLSEIMDTNVVLISPETTLAEATRRMFHERTNGVYVVDAQQRPLGIVSNQVLLRHILPEHLREPRGARLARFDSPTTFVKRVQAVASDPVSKFMRTPLHTLQVDASLLHAATYLAEYRQLPVVDAQGRVVGSVSRTHLKRAIMAILEGKR